jgi:alanine racemase
MLTLLDLLAAGGRLVAGDQAGAYDAVLSHTFADIANDSRLARTGELFVALRTPHADGHDYIPAALAAGVSGVLCSYPPPQAAGAAVILAADPVQVLQRWAARRLSAVAPVVVAVTGSVGKTAAVGAITTLLRTLGPAFRTRQNFNSLLGLPIAMARLADTDRYAALEYGTDRTGEIVHLAALFPPQIAVVTRVAEVHLDAFGTLDTIAREQASLLSALPPDGWAILNGDDPYVVAMQPQTKARILTFGTTEASMLRAADVDYGYAGTRFELHWNGQSQPVNIPLLGAPAVTTALAAASVLLVCGGTLEAAALALAQVEPNPGRLRPLPGQGGASLLDDSFSSSLPSIRAAIETLKTLPAQRRIIVLGASRSLSLAHAEEIGAQIGASADQFICLGDTGSAIVQSARRVNPELDTALADTAMAALAALPAALSRGDLVLIKGGADTRMERVTAGLVDKTVDISTALVRQESAWRSVRAGALDRPTWLRIDLDAIGQNVHRLRELAGVPLMVTLKADAYGHGAVRVARTALAHGAHALAVATIGEARALREAGIAGQILVLGYTPPWQAHEIVELRVACTLFDDEAARVIGEAASARGRTVPVHIKIDTGMARLGLNPEQAGPLLQRLTQFPGLQIEGIYTHFASADSADERFTRMQLECFTSLLDELARAGLRPPIAHAANSAALLRFPEARLDLVRPGIACYGLNPSAETPLPAGFRPALSFLTEVAQVKHWPAGTPLSYGGTFVTQRPSHIATIPVGYGDGFRRTPHWKYVLVRGRRASVVGRVAMDYALIDVTDIEEVRRGDPVVLIGAQGDLTITADDVASWLGTINYEVVTTILSRVPREVGSI